MTIQIRHLRSPDEAALAVDLQHRIWGGDEVAGHVLLTAAHNGGLLAGAFVDHVLAGFVWGFLGFDERGSTPRLKHCSHQLGVHPDYRNHGLGFLLKRFQWEFVRDQGIELITWTYDPLLATNAYLNIARLGAVSNTYWRDEYGHLHDDLNAGLPTDRLQVDLWVNSPRVHAAMEETTGKSRHPGQACWLNPPANDGSLPPPDDTRPTATDILARSLTEPDRIALAVPTDFQADRTTDLQQAAAWRYTTREAFEACFARGYTVVDFVRQPKYGCYLLEHGLESGG